MNNFVPRKWKCEDMRNVYEGNAEIAIKIATIHEEKYARLIASAPELYWMVYNLLFELKQGNGANPEYVKQAIPQIEDLLNRIKGQVKLKLCPFCGGHAELYQGSDHSRHTWRVQCNHCKCGTTDFTLPFMAAEKWNNRSELS